MASIDPTERPSYADALRGELVRAHVRLGRRRLRRQIAATMAALVATVALVTSVLPGLGAERAEADAALAMQVLPDGSRTVALLDPRAGLAEISRELEEAGIPNQTVAAVTGPSMVGTFVSVVVMPTSGNQVSIQAARDRFVIPAGFAGRLVLTVGVPAEPGEPYAAPSMAFDPGEPFAAFDPEADADLLYAEALRRGFAVRIIGSDGGPATTVPAGTKIQVAAMFGPTDLMIRWEWR
jgi:hypothetical protein